MTRPRVNLVFPGCHRRGGVERSVWELARHLKSDRHVTFVGSDLDREHLEEIRHVQVPATTGALAPAVFRRRASAAIVGIDGPVISFGANCPPGDIVWVNSVHRRWLEVSQAVTLRGLRVPASARRLLPRHQVLLALEATYFDAARHRTVVAVSQAVANDLEDLYRIDASSVQVIPNGYPADTCSRSRRLALREKVRASLGLQEDQVVLLMVANELHRKGLGVLLDAVALLGDDRLFVAVAGRTPLREYEDQIERLGIGGTVRWLGPSTDIGATHAVADLFVLPTQYEAFALAVVEALGSGLPVITTDVPGAGDLISPGENGLTIRDPLDASALAAAIDEALRAELETWSLQAEESVSSYTWSSIASRLEELLG